LTTFSVLTLVSPQREADNDAERERRGQRRDRPIGYKILDVIVLLTHESNIGPAFVA
jgi:hypothetical protein